MFAVGKTPKYVPYTIHSRKQANLDSGSNDTSVAALNGIFQKSGLADCEERIYSLTNPDARENVNATVVGGITHFLIAALNMGKVGLVNSTEEVMNLRKSALEDFANLGCYYCYDVHVVVGRKI